MKIPLITSARSVAGIMGEVRYNADTNEMQTFDGNKWRTIGDPTVKLIWRKWFAWHPVKVKGRWQWLKTVYRGWDCTKVHNGWGGRDGSWQYGDIFDVLKTT